MSAAPRRAGVAGWPVAHSLSPALHGAWIEAAGLDAIYDAVSVAPEAAARELRGLGARGYAGVNVTAPHKATALAVADDVRPAARAIGAANLLLFEDAGIVADNTDAIGFLTGLEAARGTAAAEDLVLILGAGGAARAAAFALTQAGGRRVVIANRTQTAAEQLAKAFGAAAVAWDRRTEVAADAALIVNATSLGMSGQPPLPLDLSQARDTAIVYDLVYAPLETPLLAAARRRGLRAVDGLDMLIGQARPSFEAFFGRPPPPDVDARGVLLAAMEARA